MKRTLSALLSLLMIVCIAASAVSAADAADGDLLYTADFSTGYREKLKLPSLKTYKETETVLKTLDRDRGCQHYMPDVVVK